jgi:ATP-dependent RNA helicase SUPV3L1/SUV3
VSCRTLKEAEPRALRLLTELLPKTPRAPRDFKVPVAPNNWHVQTIARRLQMTSLRDVRLHSDCRTILSKGTIHL